MKHSIWPMLYVHVMGHVICYGRVICYGNDICWAMLYVHINYIIYNLFDIIQFICTISCQPIYIDFIWSISYVPFHMMHLVRDKIHSWFDRLQSF